MENYVHAPNDAMVEEIPVSAGRTVSAGEVLVRMKSDAETPSESAESTEPTASIQQSTQQEA